MASALTGLLLSRNCIAFERLTRWVPFRARLLRWAVRKDRERWTVVQVPGGSVMLRSIRGGARG